VTRAGILDYMNEIQQHQQLQQDSGNDEDNGDNNFVLEPMKMAYLGTMDSIKAWNLGLLPDALPPTHVWAGTPKMYICRRPDQAPAGGETKEGVLFD
jgi:hypothetical protein